MKAIALFFFVIVSCTLFAQDPKIKFGKISPEDLQKKNYIIDSSTHAVVLSDVGKTEIIGNTKGWFSLKFHRHNRIHILKKSGYDEANVEVPLYTNGNATERLENLKAVTYNLENGLVVETKLDKSAIFTEKRSKNLVIKKFTLPNIKEGSVIEYSYTVESDFLSNLQPWSFQGSIPALWSEYSVSIPQFLDYVFLSQGHQSFIIKNKKDRAQTYTVIEGSNASASERHTFTSGVTDYRWAMQEVPALKTESYTSSIQNYLARIQFQLSALKDPLVYKSIMSTWPDVTKELLEDEDFGKNLNTSNNWMDEIMKHVVSDATSPLEKAKKVYSYVRDNITCTQDYGIYASQPIKNLFKSKNGKAAEINLLLTALLKHEGIDAEPVILSTRSHGITYSIYPILSRFNYIITRVIIDGKTYYLDAAHPRLGFGKLLPECYNGHARVVDKAAHAIYLQPDSLKERKLTSVIINTTDKGAWVGQIKQSLGYFESYKTREKLADKGPDAFWKEIKTAYGVDKDIEDPAIDSLKNSEFPIALRYGVVLGDHDEDIIYLNPMLGEGYKENPFKSAQRVYPVEMPYTFDETYVASLDVPADYIVDELPKSTKVKLNEEGEGYFEYLITQSGNTISMRTRLRLDRTTFDPDEYEILREFFNVVVTKQKEQIVFKKKK